MYQKGDSLQFKSPQEIRLFARRFPLAETDKTPYCPLSSGCHAFWRSIIGESPDAKELLLESEHSGDGENSVAVQPDGFRVLAGDEIGVGKFAFAIFDADALSGEFEDCDIDVLPLAVDHGDGNYRLCARAGREVKLHLPTHVEMLGRMRVERHRYLFVRRCIHIRQFARVPASGAKHQYQPKRFFWRKSGWRRPRFDGRCFFFCWPLLNGFFLAWFFGTSTHGGVSASARNG